MLLQSHYELFGQKCSHLLVNNYLVGLLQNTSLYDGVIQKFCHHVNHNYILKMKQGRDRNGSGKLNVIEPVLVEIFKEKSIGLLLVRILIILLY